jgi:hypothetical protein
VNRRAVLLAALGIATTAATAEGRRELLRSGSDATTGSAAGSPATGGPDHHVITGSYIALRGMSSAQARQKRASQLGRVDRIVSIYYAWEDPLPKRYPSVPDGSIPMLSWRGTRYASILDGSQDALIKAAAHSLIAYGKPVLMRFAWEMNGWWFNWGGSKNPSGADGFVRAWRHVHDIFTAAGATNVSWVWCPNWNDNPDRPDNAGRLFYPGDAYVDWIAVDGFSDSGETPEQLFGAFYRQYAGRKPLMIAETAVTRPDQGTPGPDAQADWIAGLSTWIKQRPDIRALVWFDTDLTTETGGTTDWRIDANAAELAAYRRLVNDPYFTA